jgi:hypothetical protein
MASFDFLFPLEVNGAVVAEIEGRCEVSESLRDDWTACELGVELYGSGDGKRVPCPETLLPMIEEYLWRAYFEEIEIAEDHATRAGVERMAAE